MNQRQVIAYLGVSLDNYIATQDEGLDWLDQIEGQGDNGYGDFYAKIDTVLMGRKTYDWISRQVAEFPYADKASFVFTRQNITSPHATVVSENPVHFVKSLKAQAGGNIWLCGGGQLLSSLLNAGLVDQLRLTIAPILLGKGISLYQNLLAKKTLTLLDNRRHGQFVELIYQVNKEDHNDITRKN